MSVLGEMVFLQAGLVGSFLLRLVGTMMVIVMQKLLGKRKSLERCRALHRNGFYSCFQSTHSSLRLLAEETIWKGLC